MNKKRLLLCYDGYIFKFNGKYYFSETDDILLKRYLRVFDNILIALRTKEVRQIDSFYSCQIVDKRVQIIEIPMFRGPLEYIKVYYKVKKIIRARFKDADAGIFRLPSTVGSVACNSLRRSRKPYLVEVVANPYQSGIKIKNFIYYALMLIIHKSLKISCANALGVSYVTDYYLPELYPARHGAVTEHYSSVEIDKDFFCNKRNLNINKSFSIIHIANNIVQSDTKGNITALHVIKELITMGHDVKITFVGERKIATLFDDIVEKFGITNNVNFVGKKTRSELRELLLQSDLLLFPSRSEGLPRTVIEAMAVSLPCIATNVGGIKELLDTETIFNVDDYQGMAKKISEIIKDINLYSHLSKRNFEKSQMYEKSILEKKRDKFYTSLLLNI